jgi:ubiquinone/menaquinone biosynthesis C-methylase UbiE
MNKNIFLEIEGDSFFNRNINTFNSSDYINNDIIINNIKKTARELNSKNILEIGCSSGWRLNELYKINKKNYYYGLDPSKDAINYGRTNFQSIDLQVSTCDEMSFYENKKFDIIMIPFVFMYLDRELLFKSITEIDRILNNNGILIITDFYSNRQRKNQYKHINDSFIHKQNYYEIFLSSKNYFLNKLECFSHNTTNDNDTYDDYCYYVELKKDLLDMFN